MNWIEQYEISVYPGKNSDELILHSPLARRQRVISVAQYEVISSCDTVPSDLTELTDYVPFDDRPKVIVPEDYTLLTVLPNNRCNFACTYCYSAGCRNAAELEFEKLRHCIDFFIESKRSRPLRRNLTISFMGGGEPMLSWPLVVSAVEYAQTKSAEECIPIMFRVITNGSLIDDESIAFIKRHNIGMSVSFEILREVQDLQRKNFEMVDGNIKRLLQEGIDTQLNVTVTPYNVTRVIETYKEMRNRYPQVKHAMFEPVTAQEMFAAPADMAAFYREYIKGFMYIYDQGKREGVEITSFPYLRTIFPLKRACPGEFCITAEGDLTGCYCVSSDAHPIYNKTHYGYVDDSHVIVDLDRFKKLIDCNVKTKSECTNCLARWNCGGGCFHLFNSYSREYCEEVCNFTRAFVYEIIKYKAYAQKDN